MGSNIIRVEKNSNYVVMNRTALQDKSLSWKAKGIMAHMLSMPDDWIFYMSEILKYSTDGEASFRSGFKELTDRGYVKRFPIREGSRIVKWKTVVYESPLLSGFQQVENQDVGSLEVGNLDVENRKLLSTDLELSTESELSTDFKVPYVEIVAYLNDVTSKNYRSTTGKTQSLIRARMNEGFTLDDFKRVIDTKSKQWLNHPKNDMYLRPETLFGTKFEGYLNEGGGKHAANKRSSKKSDEVQSRVNEANERRKRIAGIKPDSNPDNPI